MCVCVCVYSATCEDPQSQDVSLTPYLYTCCSILYSKSLHCYDLASSCNGPEVKATTFHSESWYGASLSRIVPLSTIGSESPQRRDNLGHRRPMEKQTVLPVSSASGALILPVSACSLPFFPMGPWTNGE